MLPEDDPARVFPKPATGEKANKLFLIDMFADLFLLFLSEKSEPGTHLYISEFGEP